MSEYPSGDRHESSPSLTPLSIPYLVLSAVLCGVGLFGMALFLVTFKWLFFAAVIPLVLGAYMLFTRGTGPDHA
ncbi:MAG TPA: hypothetical protein VEG66_07490 [Thermoplasmata archaeon]|nr:hypothetical protein [Thermoplasmata archaeon]